MVKRAAQKIATASEDLPPAVTNRLVRSATCPFKRLGLQGLQSIAPVLVAALATEEALLLIGPHGTAKSLLLTRVATALGLEFRHYNASLLNFDDLVGFPMPGKDGQLEYIKTPAAIWGAGAVIFDEISRCRPDIQNKLFPIIHERKVQGLPLTALRYRWSAMNPPSTDDNDNGYLGSEPLDAALADRFAFVVEMPDWSSLSDSEQLAIVMADEVLIRAADAQYLAEVIARTRRYLPAVRMDMGAGAASYVRTLMALLAQANIVLSPRRGGMLYRAVLAVNAAALALDPGADAAEAALLAVTYALPQRAQGIAIPAVKLLAAHREAWRLANIAPNDPLNAILCTADPLRRLQLALAVSGLAKGTLSEVVADTLAQLPAGTREAAIVHLFETGAVGRLNAAVAAQAAELYRDIATPPKFSETLHATNSRFKTWSAIRDLLSQLDPAEPRAHLRANALAAAFARKEFATPGDAEAAFLAFAAADTQLGTS
jgi:MoxR-like ATPase